MSKREGCQTAGALSDAADAMVTPSPSVVMQAPVTSRESSEATKKETIALLLWSTHPAKRRVDQDIGGADLLGHGPRQLLNTFLGSEYPLLRPAWQKAGSIGKRANVASHRERSHYQSITTFVSYFAARAIIRTGPREHERSAENSST